MIKVKVRLDKIVIAEHNRGEAIIETYFTEGQHNGVLRQKTRFNDAEKLSEDIIKMIRKEVKKQNTPGTPGEDIFDDTVNVVFTCDEDVLLKKMRFFFSKILSNIKGVRMTGTPLKYLDAVNKIKGTELKF